MHGVSLAIHISPQFTHMKYGDIPSTLATYQHVMDRSDGRGCDTLSENNSWINTYRGARRFLFDQTCLQVASRAFEQKVPNVINFMHVGPLIVFGVNDGRPFLLSGSGFVVVKTLVRRTTTCIMLATYCETAWVIVQTRLCCHTRSWKRTKPANVQSRFKHSN